MKLALTISLAAAWALALSAAEPTDDGRESLLDGGGLLDDSAVPITPPAIVDEHHARRVLPAIPEGATIFDRRVRLRRGANDKWWVVDDPKADQIRLLPCELLETAENIHGRAPDTDFKLSGEVYHYDGRHYLMLRRVLRVLPEREPAPRPTTRPAPPPVAATQPASAPAAATTRPSGATADDVAGALLGEIMGRPVVAPRHPVVPVAPAPSVVRAGEPLPPGPGRMVIGRLGRLAPAAGRWRLLAFEADNTLREPPVNVLPNEHLRRMELLSQAARRRQVVFNISGEIHQYRGRRFLLVRNAIVRRDMDQF